ncbi:putative delta-12 fatty acid desaturase [Sugiyamaella lignohabitans]|uniref:Putative delta-12 fatty acid desaturase n=1 Tax=Sugiyamaella lignohabitans TaxID=796027 RepID=A0A167DCK4_9ASCO|nr:putative delta-12 fatty acid desaturase [Sugiyamaella lignohabitans]ANB12763.1 putative delta-12 fatty acid desaturase [Sugiyamaella lignohabitans]
MSSVTVTQRRPSSHQPQKPSFKKAINTYGEEFIAPQFTIKEILDAIPPECYKRSLPRSLGYVIRDGIFIGLFGYLAISYIHLIPWLSVRVLAWAAYTIVQGLFGTGWWVLAHECGHGAFSDYKWANDTVGWVLHSFLLVPYHSWRISHSKHHKATGHLTRDMVFVPKEKETFFSIRGIKANAEDTPIVTLYGLILQQTFGWLMYLTTNVTGQKYPTRSKWVTNHYVPSSPIFDKKDFYDIIISDIGIGLTLGGLYYSIQRWGLSTVILMYVLPWMWVNHWLVHITYLQHTDPRLPHYDADEWSFARGAAATVDRDFGFIGKHILHDIIETHVLHHYVSRIPFYNGRKGTEAIKKVLGKHYVKDESNFITSLYRVARSCQFIEGDNGIKMFRNINNIGVPPTNPGKRLSDE